MKFYLLLALLLLPRCVWAAEATDPKLPHFDFENGVTGWASLSPAGSVLAAKDPARVRAGAGSLEYRYEAKKDQVPILALPVAGLAGMKSFRVDVQTDSPTLLLVALAEEGGARYEYLTATPAQGWLHLEIGSSEWVRADDSKDVNNRLDLDQVRSVLFADMRAVLTAMGHEMAKLIGERTGEHVFWLDNLVGNPETVLTAPPAGQLVIDDFRRENIQWLPLAGISLKVGPAPGGEGGRALSLDYNREVGKLAAIIRPVAPGSLAGMEKITFGAAAKQDTSLAVVLEETGGARYTATVFVAGGGFFQRFATAQADFKLVEDTKDENNRLDPGQVKSIGFFDLAGLTGGTPGGASTLWLRDIRAAVATGTLESR